jgi:hypothetical protein
VNLRERNESALKRTIAAILVLSVLLGMVTVLAAGSTTDPLISRSYLEGAYRTSLISAIRAALAPAITAPMNELGEVEGRYKDFKFAPRFTEISVRLSETVNLSPGASFTLTSGSATLHVTKGTVINVSTGVAVASASQLTRNQRYFCTEDATATVTASSALTGYVDGYYRVNAPAPPPASTVSPIDQFVITLYRNIFGRNPTDTELSNWVNQLRNGRATGASIAQALFFSNEFLNRNVNNSTFVDILYRALLNRSADAAGRTTWINHVNAGMSRESALSGFINSPEFDRRCRQIGIKTGSYTPQPTDMIRVFVTRLYVEILNRQPDTAGLNHWIDRLKNGASGSTVAHGFIFSTELTRRNLTNEDFVEMLYKSLLGRASDQAGKTNWVNQLNNGTSRQTVFNGFANSVEFERLCRNHGIRR